AQHPDAPLQRCVDRVLPVHEGEAEDVLDRPADRGLVPEPGELEAAAPAPDHAGLVVADEEGRVRVRVVVVEQLEEESEAAFLAAARRGAEARGPLGGSAPVSAVGTNEDGHASSLDSAGDSASVPILR